MILRTSALALVCCLATACGDEIGDSCTISTDCSSQNTRICDTNSPGGYCTIQGCDVGTCPDEAVCVRFFPVVNTNRLCDPTNPDGGQDVCRIDEICTLSGTCAPRSSEVRFCMRTCKSHGDCRDEYECRDAELMKMHGGQPVVEDGAATDFEAPERFCAAKPL